MSIIKRLSQCVRQYKRDSLLTPLFIIGEVVLEVAIPFLMANLIDEGINVGSMQNVVKYGLILVGCAVVSLVFGMLAGVTASRASAGFAANLRHDMYYRIQDYSFANIDKFSTASLVTRMTTDVTNVQNSFQMIIRIAVRCPLMLISAMVMSFTINAELAWIFLATTPVLGIGMFIIIKKAFPLFIRIFKTYDKLNSVVQENVRGIRVVKSYVREDHEIEKFDDISKTIYNDFSKAERTVAFNAPLMQFCVYLCTILLAWFGASMIIKGEGGMTTGKLTSLISYTMQILMSLMMVSMVAVMITMSKASAERIFEVLEEKSDITDPKDAVTTVKNGNIRFENVGFSYAKDKDKLCLRNVSIDIKSGETVGIIGGTGSSKTSLVQLIPRLYDVTTGSLQVGDVDVKNYDLTALRDSVAMVLQKNILFSGTIKENLRWGNESATDEDIVRVCKLACADEFIEQMPDKYDTHIEQGGNNVSGGQKQRLCIARALLKSPKVLILDDSTSAVDTKTDSFIRRAFATEIPDVTKLIIAQRISSVESADKIIVLEGGEINGFGTHEELLKTNAIYQEVYYSQNKISKQADACGEQL